MTNEQLIKKIIEVHGNKFDLSKVKFIAKEKDVIIICKEHGEREVRVSRLIKGSGCRLCSRRFIDNDIFINESIKKFGDKFDYSKCNYKSSRYRIKLRCKVHNNDLEPLPQVHLKNEFGGCYHCWDDDRRNKKMQKFIKDSEKIYLDKFDYSKMNYVNSKVEIEIICRNGHQFFRTPDYHLSGFGCPKCSENISFGERFIRNYLDSNKIEYVVEKTFTNCINPITGRRLRFDFYLPNHKLLIEFDGVQHREPVNFGGSSDLCYEAFCKRIGLDAIKNIFSASNGINLLRINSDWPKSRWLEEIEEYINNGTKFAKIIENKICKNGHFELKSGRHSDRYLNCFNLLKKPNDFRYFVERLFLSSNLDLTDVNLIVTPAIGGILVGYELSRLTGINHFFLEKEDGELKLRRDFEIKSGDKILIADNILTSGKTIREVIEVVKSYGGIPSAVITMVDRSNGLKFGIPSYSLIEVGIDTYEKENCKQCMQGIPLNKPGSKN